MIDLHQGILEIFAEAQKLVDQSAEMHAWEAYDTFLRRERYKRYHERNKLKRNAYMRAWRKAHANTASHRSR